jgi:hypothetical protein
MKNELIEKSKYSDHVEELEFIKTEKRFKHLEGKTILEVKRAKYQKYDDEPFLILYMSDGSIFRLEGNYGGYTGSSEDEYYRYISIENIQDEEA